MMKITDLSKCKNFYCPPEVQFIELQMANSDRNDNVEGCSADFEGSLAQKGNKIFLYNKLALKKRVYEASDWDNYRDAVNAHKTYGDYLVIKK